MQELTRPFSCHCVRMQTSTEKKQSGIRGGRVHAHVIAKRESQSTLILIYVSQTSTEMEQSGIEVGVRAIRKWWECCLQGESSFCYIV